MCLMRSSFGTKLDRDCHSPGLPTRPTATQLGARPFVVAGKCMLLNPLRKGSSTMVLPLVILGCGFTGLEVARLGLRDGSDVIGTTRTAGPADGVLGRIDRRVVPVL